MTVKFGFYTPLALPRVASASLLLDIRASQLSLSEGDSVSTWADMSGNGHNFTQTGSARPMYSKIEYGGIPYVRFDGVDDWMSCPDLFADNLDSFSVFVYGSFLSLVITKINNYSSGAGWEMDGGGSGVIIQENGGNNWIQKTLNPFNSGTLYDSILEVVSKSELHVYLDGSNVNETDQSAPPVNNYSTSEIIRIATRVDFGEFAGMDLMSFLIYAPSPAPADRDAIVAWLATHP